jgi:hypothetical protein
MPLGSSSAAPVTIPGPNMRNNLRADAIIDPVWVLTLVIMLVIFDPARSRKIFRLVNGERSAFVPENRPRSYT